MSYILTHPETRTEPAEYADGSPVQCATCSREWDEDEDEGSGFEHEDGEIYCIGDCLNAARDKVFRRDASEIMLDKINEAAEEIGDLGKEYADCCENEPCHPYALLDDARDRMKRFAEGKETGWRSGVMLTYVEADQIENALDSMMRHLLNNLHCRWTLIEKGIQASEYQAEREARELVRVARAKEMLHACERRTRYGEFA